MDRAGSRRPRADHVEPENGHWKGFPGEGGVGLEEHNNVCNPSAQRAPVNLVRERRGVGSAHVRMSGSGSTLFTLCAAEDETRRMAQLSRERVSLVTVVVPFG